MGRRLSQRALQRWFPDVVRYAGIVLMLYCALTRQWQFATPATGMIFFKNIVGDGSKD